MRLGTRRQWTLAATTLLCVGIGYLGAGIWVSRSARVVFPNSPKSPAASETEPAGDSPVPSPEDVARQEDQAKRPDVDASFRPEAQTKRFEAPLVAERQGDPVRIAIPSIAVDAIVERVTLATDGSMGVPGDPGDAGWYALGPRPGESGSATIAGHVAWYGGATAVFSDLHRVAPGDTIVVENNDGTEVTFVVRETRTYAADADAREVFVSADGISHLNLITCVGEWDQEAKQYAERLVVFADRETK